MGLLWPPTRPSRGAQSCFQGWKQAASSASLGPGTGSGHGRWCLRQRGCTRGKGLSSVPTPDPQAAPGHLRLQVPRSPATPGPPSASQPNLCSVSPAPTAGRLGGIVQRSTSPGWDSPATTNLEQKLEGGVGVPWSYSAHQTVLHLQRSSFGHTPTPASHLETSVFVAQRVGFNNPSKDLPPHLPGEPLQLPASAPSPDDPESGVAGKQGQPKPTLHERPPGTAPHPAAICPGLLPRAWPGWVQGPCGIRRCEGPRLPAPGQGNNTPWHCLACSSGPQE